MKAVRIHDFGGSDVLHIDDVEMPQPKDDEVLVKVHAASVNPVDWKIRSGDYPMVKQENLPMTMGRDIAGEIESCGTRARNMRKGDAIYAFLGMGRGGYQEYVTVKASELAAMPGSLSYSEAAAVPLAGITAWQGLFDHGRLTEGQRVLIHGGSGGVGHLAVQFAKTKGAWVATTVSEPDLKFARELGADQVIDYKAERFEEVVEPVDLVFDLISGETRERSFDVLKEGGVMVSTLGKPDEGKARKKNVRVAGYMAQPNGAQLNEIGQLIDRGKVKVAVDRVFQFAEAARAQECLEQEHVRGKIVLVIAD
jgi:NADPH:quinone reductase-like Zn-dependent oxidoreductase